jgi:cell division protein ZapA
MNDLSAESVAVTVKILDKEYKIGCQEHEKQSLLESAQYLDKKMQEVKAIHKIIGADRLAVMAALNIAHELLQCQSDGGSADSDTRLQEMTDKLQHALNRYR